MQEICLLACLPVACSACFLIQPKATCPRMALPKDDTPQHRPGPLYTSHQKIPSAQVLLSVYELAKNYNANYITNINSQVTCYMLHIS